MLEVIAYIAPLGLVGLVGAYIYVEAEKQKAIKAKKKAIVVLIAKMKSTFKADVNQLVEQQILTVNQHKSVYRIANNFFIFQPVTVKSMAFCAHSLNNVISAIPNGGPETIHFNLIQEQISLFVRALPVAANGYKGSFYRNELPKLTKQLVDVVEKICEVENALSNETLFTCRVPEVA
jgi:hypothetical protein